MPKRTHEELYEAILKNREISVDTREKVVELKEHVNDEIETMQSLLDTKLDSDHLLPTLGVQILVNRRLRWILGITISTVLASIVSQHWLPWIDRVFQVFWNF